jgi:hypothetical protein
MILPKWANIIMWGDGKMRKKIVDAVHVATAIFKKGKETKEGKEFQKLIKSSKVELIGFCPLIHYIRVDSSHADDLQPIWEHKFSAPVLLYQLKDAPVMLLINPNGAYNHSILADIPDNDHIEEIRNLRGIIG